MARAQGARAQMALAFETIYGTPPAGGFTEMPFASTSLGAEQPLLNSELLGYPALQIPRRVVVPQTVQRALFAIRARFQIHHVQQSIKRAV